MLDSGNITCRFNTICPFETAMAISKWPNDLDGHFKT